MTTLIVAAHGNLKPIPNLLDGSADEDLYSVFLARSELMRWSNLNAVAQPETTTPLWWMNDAELNLDPENTGIRWAQVSLDVGPVISAPDPSEYPTLSEEGTAQLDPSKYDYAPYPIERGPPTDPAVAIPPMVQCFDDAIRKFGEADVTAHRVEIYGLSPSDRSEFYPLAGVRNWFNVNRSATKTHAIARVQADLWEAGMAEQVVADIQQTRTRPFSFGSSGKIPQGAAVAVSMPEWSSATAGWVTARLFDAVLTPRPDIAAPRGQRDPDVRRPAKRALSASQEPIHAPEKDREHHRGPHQRALKIPEHRLQQIRQDDVEDRHGEYEDRAPPEPHRDHRRPCLSPVSREASRASRTCLGKAESRC